MAREMNACWAMIAQMHKCRARFVALHSRVVDYKPTLIPRPSRGIGTPFMSTDIPVGAHGS